MYEVEIKVRAAHDAVRDRLTDLDATALGAVTQVDEYFAHPTRDFARTDEALRLRRESDGQPQSRLTYKGPLVDAASKTRTEIETGIADADAMAEILSSVGFEGAATVRKRRDRYRLDGYTIALDRVESLGEFVEVEIEADEATIADKRDGVRTVLRRIDLDPDEQIRESYLGLLLDRGDYSQ